MHSYYTIVNQQINEQDAVFIVSLNPDCPVYDGHFPGNPIAPGACNIEMVRQCAALAIGREIRLTAIRVCKFMMLLRPGEPELLSIQLNWTTDQLSATILAENNLAVQLKMNIQCLEK